MEEWLTLITRNAVLIIDAMALVVIAIGTVEAFIGALRVAWVSSPADEKRSVLIHYGRWLVAGLTFQLAADIIETSIAPTWQEIAQVGAIAVIRTFLNFFLERDLKEAGQIIEGRVEKESAGSPTTGTA
jgi:uncharacterized membrane protein